MLFSSFHARSRNPTFVRVPLPVRTFRRAATCPRPAICCTTPPPSKSPKPSKPATPPPSSATPLPTQGAVDPQPGQQIAERLATAHVRAGQLHTRLIARLVDTATHHVQTVLRAPQTPHNAATDTVATTTARRLRRELRSLRASSDDALPPDNVVWTSIARLETLVEELERRADTDAAFARDRVQEDLEDGVRITDDAGEELDEGSAIRPAVGWRQPAEGLRRKVSDVGEVIEGRVAAFVRRDGSIDVDGLRGFVRGILDSIGMTWMRLNGRVPPATNKNMGDEESAAAVPSVVSQLPPLRDDEREFRLREEIGELEKQLIDSSKSRENALRREDQLGKLMRAKEIRLMDDAVCALRRTLAVRVLQLELEKVFIGVAEEIDSTEYEGILDQRVLVVEFEDLDERLSTLDLFVEQEEPLLIDDDTVGDLAADIQDMKMRLGLDAPLYSSATLSWDQVRQFWAASSKKTRAGAEFYSRGIRLFAGDLRFAFRLIRRAVLGYTPSGREVRTLRRTGRDLLTLVPFTIVLIAPLTPVGHVLIFSFLQRYWPEFFPSTFSERRQSLMKKREQYLKVLESEDEGEMEDNGEGDGKSSGGGGGGGAMFESLRKFVGGGGWSVGGGGDEGANGGKDVGGVVDARVSNGVGGEEERPVMLRDLADSVLDSDRKARKQRNAIALDELHLAD